MPRRVAITGVGALCGLGATASDCWTKLSAGHSAIVQLEERSQGTKIRVGAVAPQLDAKQHFSPEARPLLDRFAQFAVIAAREAVTDSGLERIQDQLERAGAVIGTGCGAKHTDEDAYRLLYKHGEERIPPLTIPKGMPSAAASMVSQDLGIRGPVFSVASACASGAHAIIQGHLMIKAGLVDVALVGGTDAPFTYGLMRAWEALRVVSNETCRPFSRDRSGMVLGEGAGMLVLEEETHARRRGARVYAHLAGCGMSSDAGHITRPNVDGIAAAIRNALTDACIPIDCVDYVNAHGTGTLANDLAETEALHRVFGTHAKHLAVSSTKSMHGHALGAASALEAIATVLALHHHQIPPTANFTEPGEGCDLDYVPNTGRKKQINVAISNAFAFGGLNAVIAIKRPN
jgi:nodulation protein E